MRYDFLIVGAGFAGCVLAERLASLNKTVFLVEKRNHIGGNAFDFSNKDGLLVQKYGPHIFHTNNEKVWKYLSQFTNWNNYIHQVLVAIDGKKIHLPINCKSMEAIYGKKFSAETMASFLKNKRVEIDKIQTARDVVISQVGDEIYDLIFKNYTKKQWGIPPEELEALVTKRLPVRFNEDCRYFTDSYQGMPEQGFTALFNKMLAHKNITILLNTDYKNIKNKIVFNNLIYTGPIDEYFNYQYGVLPYRSLDFKFETFNNEVYQEVGVVNYPSIEVAFTRITEFKHLYQQQNDKTTICFEYPRDFGDPYYPIPKADYLEIYKSYQIEAAKGKNVYFIGRLAEYAYLNMDQIVERALILFDNLQKCI